MVPSTRTASTTSGIGTGTSAPATWATTALTRSTWRAGRSATDLPKRVSGSGAKYFFDDDQQTPDTMNMTFDYGDKGPDVGNAHLARLRHWKASTTASPSTEPTASCTSAVGTGNGATGIFDKAGKLVTDYAKARAGFPHAQLRRMRDLAANAPTAISRSATSRARCATWATSCTAPAATSASIRPTRPSPATPEASAMLDASTAITGQRRKVFE